MEKFITALIILFLPNISFPQSGWISQYSGTKESLRSVRFLNSNTGWTIGTNGILLKTTDGGDNWNLIPTGAFSDFHSLFIVSDSILLAAGDFGIIIKTTDAGNNWTYPDSKTKLNLNSIFFVNSSTGWASGFEGTILKTTDTGSTWLLQNSNINIQLNSIQFANTGKGWAAGYGGIFYSSNGGVNWAPQFLDGSLLLNSIFFTDSLNGWAAYYDNQTFGTEIIKTTSGGFSWLNYPMVNTFSRSLFFINSSKGWSSADYGKISYSIDGGISWTVQMSVTTENLYSVYLIDSLNGWTVGNSGTILKTTTGGILTNYTSATTKTPEYFSLEQNYPNPFNPSTKIIYTVIKTEKISLSVYDVLGNAVSMLVNEKQTPGQYEVEFKGINFPSGIYYYRIESEDFYKTKKMILIR